jgi:2-polyprenyl-6-methoxyphenol hydroxylase-like FAD-dependent oxidoreductase
VYDVIKTATPLSEPVSFRFPSNQWRHYEKLVRFPAGFLPIGDAICSFTPIYGQGITVAALEALSLQECLRAGTRTIAQRFFRETSKVLNIPWSITVGNDKRLSMQHEAASLKSRFLNWYMPRFHVAARRDPVVSLAFRKVANLYAAPTSLLHPRILRRVVWASQRTGPQQKPVAGARRSAQSNSAI